MQQNPAYDYNRELVAQQESLWDWLVQKFLRWVDSFFDDSLSVGVRNAVLMFLGVVVIGLIAWFLYRYRPELFMRNRKAAAEEEELPDNIYGVDFDDVISRAVSQEDYHQAVRFVYLKTLRRLSDTGRIDWQPSKTPTQYVREFPSEAFRLLTQHFLRVRYGNFEATRGLYDEVLRLSQEGGAA